MLNSPAVLLAVVTHNSAALLEDFARVLPAALEGVDSWSLTIVDSGSTDDTVETACRILPDATVIDLGANRGYSAGLNAALASAPPTRALFALNPDIRLGTRSVAGCSTRWMPPGWASPCPGCSRPTVRRAPRSVDGRPSRQRAGGRGPGGQLAPGGSAPLGEVVTDTACYDARAPGPGRRVPRSSSAERASTRWSPRTRATGCTARRSISRERAIASADSRLRYIPDATAVHLGGEAHVRPELWALSTVNRVRQFASCHGRSQTLAFRAALVLNESIRAAGG